MTQVPRLSTHRLQLRGWRATDREPLAAIKREPKNWRYVAGGQPLTATEGAAYLDELDGEWKRWGVGSWAVIESSSGSLLGDCGIKLTERGPQLAYMLGHEFWGRGFATEASRVVLDHVFDHYDWPVIGASTDRAHTASQRVLEKLGMRRRPSAEATERHEYWYEIRRDDYLASAGSPTSR